MWLILIPLAALVGYAIAKKEKTGSVAKPPVGTGTVDGHGTGVLQPVTPSVLQPTVSPTVDGHSTGVLEPDPLIAAAAAQKIAQDNAAKAAAVQAAANIANLHSPQGVVDQAAAAAEATKLQIMSALNTPETDRTPEQLALLSGLASLPIVSSK